VNLDNIFLFEQSPEALEAVKSGEALVSSGGIRRKGKGGSGFLEQAKPATLSVGDFTDLFEGKEHALKADERIGKLEEQLSLSVQEWREIENIEWLNNALIQRTYVLSYEGFHQTLNALECVTQRLSGFEQYVKKRDIQKLIQEMQTYINYLKTDAGDLRSKKYNVTNGKIAEHLDQISAFIKRLLLDLENEDENSFISVLIIQSLLPPFSYVVRRFSAMYFYENDCELMPGDYDEWVKTIALVAESDCFREKCDYYIKLKTTIPFREKILISKKAGSDINKLLSSVKFDQNYIKGHSKEEYLSISDQVCQKFIKNEYYIVGKNVVLFLDGTASEDEENGED